MARGVAKEEEENFKTKNYGNMMIIYELCEFFSCVGTQFVP